ncbi:MAG: dicarboxylate/amino acid:cation symporter [Phycisphaerales bacterium]
MKQPSRWPLHTWILTALAAGLLVGLAINRWWTPETWGTIGVGDAKAFLSHTPSEHNAASGAAQAARFTAEAGRFVGDLFLRLLRLMAVPVVLFSLISAVAGVGDPKELGRMGARTLAVFALTALLAVCIALGMTLAVRPGTHISDATRAQLIAQQADTAKQRVDSFRSFESSNTLWSQVLDAFAANPFKALADANMLQVVTLSLMLGVGLLMVDRHKRDATVRTFDTLADACLRVVVLLMKLAPLAVFVLSATLAAGLGLGVVRAMSVFVGATAAGLALILFVQYPAVMWFLTPRNRRMKPMDFFRAMGPAMTLAFSSSSSAATMPVTMECCDELRVPRRVSGFVVPLGTTINMDGTALYQVMCVTFLAQLYGIPLSIAEHATIACMAILVAIGSPGLPGASIVLMVFILEAFKIPLEGLAIILATDRVLDMCRTVVNVAGDACASVIVAGKERGVSPA